jgi:predicted Na+-dependent transporter
MDAWVIPAGVLLVLILVAPGRIGERLIGSVFQLVLWIVKLPFRAGQTFFRTVLVWMGMEVRRWVGILVGGVLVLIVAQTIIRETQPGSPWRLVALLMCLIWLVALFGAGRMTLEYLSLRRVRQNRQFVELAEGVRNIQGQVRSLQGQLVGTAAQQP